MRAALFILLTLTAGSLWTAGPARAQSPEEGPIQKESRIPEEVQIREEEQKAFEEARRLLDGGNDELGLIAIQEFLQHFSSSTLVPQAELRLGQLYEKKGDHVRAAAVFERTVSIASDPIIGADAREHLARSLWRNGDADRALGVALEALKTAPTPDYRLRLHHLAAEISRARHDAVGAIRHLMDERSLVSERGPAETAIREIVDEGLPEPVASTVLEAYPGTFPSDYVLWRLIESYRKQAIHHVEEKTLLRFLADFPDHQESRRARQALFTLREQLKAPRFRLGVLLPLSGPLRDYGRRILNGIQLAAEGSERIVGIVVRDTEGPAARLEEALEELHREYGAIGAIGPLLSREVELLGNRARRLGLPLVTPSAVGALSSEADHYVFRTAMTTAQQGTALAEYASDRLGLHRFAILHPDDTYGAELTSVFMREVMHHGGEVIALESYAPQEMDFGPAIKRLREQILARAAGPAVQPEQPATGDSLPGLDAVFLPGDPDHMMLIAAQLAFYDVRHVVLLGTGGWTTESLRRLGSRFLEGSILVDGFFAGSPDPGVQTFVAQYKAKFLDTPDLFAAQAYDATRLVIAAIDRGATTGREVRDALLQVKEYRGVSGAITMTPSGQADKRLFVLRVRNGQLIQVQAP